MATYTVFQREKGEACRERDRERERGTDRQTETEMETGRQADKGRGGEQLLF